MSTPPARPLVAALVLRTLGFAFLWWAITEAAPGAWLFGAIGSVLAAALSLWLLPPPWPRIRVLGLLRFIPYFLAQSVSGGLDVVRRACSARVQVDPALVEYDVARMGRAERVAFTLVANLIPGTLSTTLDDDRLTLHAIDRALPVQASLQRLEQHIAAIFGRPLAEAA